MELKYKSAEKDYGQSFYFRRELIPYLEGNWHYHEDYEILYIIRGEGVRIVGDNLSNFGSPQLALIGPWLPHLWKNVESQNEEISTDIIVIKFNRLISGQDIFSIPEFEGIADLLKKSQQGLLWGPDTISRADKLLKKIPECNAPDRIITFFNVLNLLSESDDFDRLSSAEFTLPTTVAGETRLSRIINYISEHFTSEISLDELATVSAMTISSLCRFFKNRTNKTISQFVNEFRVGKACQMIISGNLSISEICFQSGFNSLTTFNRVFKQMKKVTPREYKEKYRIL